MIEISEFQVGTVFVNYNQTTIHNKDKTWIQWDLENERDDSLVQ